MVHWIKVPVNSVQAARGRKDVLLDLGKMGSLRFPQIMNTSGRRIGRAVGPPNRTVSRILAHSLVTQSDCRGTSTLYVLSNTLLISFLPIFIMATS